MIAASIQYFTDKMVVHMSMLIPLDDFILAKELIDRYMAKHLPNTEYTTHMTNGKEYKHELYINKRSNTIITNDTQNWQYN